MLVLGNKLTLNAQKPIYHFVNKYSIVFDGVDDCIITDGADTVAQPTTYSFWCKSSTTGGNLGVFGHGAGNTGAFHFNFSSGKPLLYLGAGSFINWNISGDQQDDGEWHHWVVYSDTNNIANSKLYVDGVLQIVDGATSTPPYNAYTESLTIAADQASGGNHFEGNIDEFAVFDRELTQAEITRMYNTYYSPNRVANGNFSQIGNEEVENGNFSEVGADLVVNGDFATDSDWTYTTGVNQSWSISGGTANSSGTQSGLAYFNQDGAIVSGKTYKATFTVVSRSAGGVLIAVGGTSGTTRTATGTYTQYITAASNQLWLRADSSFAGSIDNVSCKEVGQDWTLGGTDWSIGDSKLIGVNAITETSQQILPTTIARNLKISFDIVVDSGSIAVYMTDESKNWITSSTSIIKYVNSSSKILEIDGRNSDPFNGSVTNISVKEVGQGWTFGTGWSTDGTKAISDGSQTGNSWLIQAGVLVAGRTYKFSFDLIVNSGQVVIDSYASPTPLTSTNFYEFSFVAATSSFQVMANSTFTGSADNIVVQELKHDATNLMLNAGAYQSANPLITSTNSMEFDGVDDYLQLSEPFNYTNHTITGWIKSSQDTGVGLIFDGRDGTNDNVAIYLNNGVLYYNLGGFVTNSVSSIATGKWVNITCSYDGATAKIYLDGVLANSVSGVGTISSIKNAVIGINYLDFQEYDGYTTEIGTYNRTLTSLEVASLYNQGMPTNLLVNRNDYQSGNPTVFNTKQVDFDGVDDFMQISPLGLTGTFTYSFWYKGDGNPDFLAGDSATDTKIGFLNSAYFIRLSVNGDNTIALGTLDWNHLVVTRDSSNKVDLYVNGGSANRLFSDVAQNSTVNLDYIGRTNSGLTQNYDGQLSQAGVWNSTLTADEVSSLYNHGLPVDLNTNQAAYTSSSNLVGYWRMGSGTLDSYPLIADQTNATLGNNLASGYDFTSGWGIFGGGTSITNSTSFESQSGQGIYTGLGLVVNKLYKIKITGTQPSGGYFSLQSGTTGTNLKNISGTSFNEVIYATPTVVTGVGNDFYIRLSSHSVGSLITISNLEIQQVNGNPAIMTNMTASDIENGSPYANIVTNGTFDTDSDWSKGSGWSISNGEAVCILGSGNLQQDVSVTANKNYKVTFEVTDYTSGTLYVDLGGSTAQTTTSTGNKIFYFTTTSTNNLRFYGGVFSGSIDNVTVAEVNTGLQGYWKMGSGINDEYPVIYDQTNPTVGTEKVINGDFSNGTTGWIITDGSATVTNGAATILGNSANGGIYQTILQTGSTYFVEIEVLSINSGNWYAGGYVTNIYAINNIGKISFNYTSTGNGFHILSSGGAGSITIDNVSVKEVQGNPATMTNMVEGNITNQYPLTKIRNYYRMGDGILDKFPIIQDQTSPNLAHIPTTNLIIYSQDFTNAIWNKSTNATITSSKTDLSGNNTASRLQMPSGSTNYFYTVINGVTSGSVYTYSIYMKSNTNSSQNVRIIDGVLGVGGGFNTAIVTTLWKRFDLSITATSTNIALQIDNNGGSYDNDILICFSQTEQQHQATAYLPSYGVASVRKATTTNLITYSEDLSEWNLVNGTITPNATVSPDGTQNADKVVFNQTGLDLKTTITVVAGQRYTMSFYIKLESGTGLLGRFYDNSNGANIEYYDYTSQIQGTEWSKITRSVTAPVGCTEMQIWLISSSSTLVTASFWGAQFEEQTQAETYAPTFGLPVTIDLFTENNYGTMINMTASDIVPDTPNN